MFSLPRLRRWMAALALLGLNSAAQAAPAPPFVVPFEKYLPDDTVAIAVVNVKQMVGSPLFVKNYRKQVEALLKTLAVQAEVVQTGLDPLRNIDRVALVMHAPEPAAVAARLTLLVQGRFDSVKLRARMKQLARDMPGMVKIHTPGAAPIYEIAVARSVFPGPLFVTQLDRNTLLLASQRDTIDVARDKVAGKKKTVLKYRALSTLLKDLKPETSVRVVAVREAVLGTESRSTFAGCKTTTTIKHHTLGEAGFDTVAASVAISTGIKARVTLTAPDVPQAKKMARVIGDGLRQVVAGLKEKVAKEKDLAPALKALEAVKLRGSGPAIILEVEGDVDIIQGMLLASGVDRALGIRPPPPEPR